MRFSLKLQKNATRQTTGEKQLKTPASILDSYLYGNKVSMVDSCHVENKTGWLLCPQLKLNFQSVEKKTHNKQKQEYIVVQLQEKGFWIVKANRIWLNCWHTNSCIFCNHTLRPEEINKWSSSLMISLKANWREGLEEVVVEQWGSLNKNMEPSYWQRLLSKERYVGLNQGLKRSIIEKLYVKHQKHI